MYDISFNDKMLIVEGESRRIGIVADIHIGVEYEYADKGIKIIFQYKKITESLAKDVIENGIDELVLLGDVKHSVVGFRHYEAKMVHYMLSLLKNRARVSIVPGNHDGGIEEALPEEIELVSPRGRIVVDSKGNPLSLIHGHAWPSPKLFSSEVIIVAHSHPTIELRDPTGYRVVEPVWIKARVLIEKLAESYLRYKGLKEIEHPIKLFKEMYGFEPKTKYLVIIPAYNPLMGGIKVNRRDMGPQELIGVFLLNQVVDLDTAEIYLTDGTYLGELRYIV